MNCPCFTRRRERFFQECMKIDILNKHFIVNASSLYLELSIKNGIEFSRYYLLVCKHESQTDHSLETALGSFKYSTKLSHIVIFKVCLDFYSHGKFCLYTCATDLKHGLSFFTNQTLDFKCLLIRVMHLPP